MSKPEYNYIFVPQGISAYLFDLLQENLDKYPVILGCTFTKYNSGTFGGGDHPELKYGQPELNRIERLMVDHISKLLPIRPKVRIIDIGAMLGLSLNIIGWVFPQEVESGRLELFATNYDENFTIEKGVMEAERRNKMLDCYHKLIQESYLDRDDPQLSKALKDSSIFFRSLLKPAEIEFLKKNKHRIRYVSPIATTQLLDMFGPEHFDAVHEFNGGVYYYKKEPELVDQLDQAVGTMVGILNRDHGLILTHEDLSEQHHAFSPLIKAEVVTRKVYQINPDCDYLLYKMPGC